MIKQAESKTFHHPSDERPFNPWRNYVESLPDMVYSARRMRKKAIQEYRQAVANGARHKIHKKGFIVASRVLGVDLSTEDTGVVGGLGSRPHDGKIKVCAETRALAKSYKDEKPFIIGGVVIGPPQKDKESGLKSDTLHCCGICRTGCIPKMAQGHTLWTTVRPTSNDFQIQTSDQLIALHEAAARGEDPAQPPTYHDPGFGKLRLAHDENDYDALLPEGFDPLISEKHQKIAVVAARIVISGIMRESYDGRRDNGLLRVHQNDLTQQLLAA